MALSDGLISFWEMEEASGNRLDTEVVSNDWVPRGSGVTRETGLVNFGVGQQQNGMEQASGTPFQFGDTDFTLATWINAVGWTDGSSPQRLIFTKWNGSGLEWNLDWLSSSDRFRWSIRNAGDTASVSVNADSFGAVSGHTSEWILIVVWHDSVNDLMGIAVNGGSADTTAISGGTNTTSVKAALGTRDGGGASAVNNINGVMDQTGVWSRVLSSTERTDFYNGGSGLSYADLTPSPPAAPSGLIVEAVGPNAVDLFWTDNSGNEDNFEIERSVVGGGSGFTNVATLGAGVVTHTDTGLSANTQYYYRVRATNDVGNSSYSSEANDTTLAALPASPTLLTGLISHWSFEESGDLATRVDDHGSNDLTPRGAGTPQETVDHLLGSAAVDINQLGLETTDGTPFAFGNSSFTIATWVNSATWSGSSSLQRLILTKGNAVASEWQLDWIDTASPTADRFRFQIRNRTNTAFLQLVAENFGAVKATHVDEWIFIVAWHDAVNDLMGISVNDGTPNTLTSGVVGGIQTANQTRKTGIGTRDGGGASAVNNINGYMDNTSIWDRVLTSDERTSLYNGGTGLLYSQYSGVGGGGASSDSLFVLGY